MKKKIFNDPIYGFISVPDEVAFQLLEHPWFQRLRRIKQLGLTNLVYPGSLHTRFHHAMGAMHLMSEALEVLRGKGHDISDEEFRGAVIAILLHDIGHGPFSHALENSIVHEVSHEDISELFMNRFNEELSGKLSLAIKIFRNEYKKKFLHQLVSSQLDMDRLDYLRRDSFYTGAHEGVIGTERIIKMLDVANDELVVDVRGIYSVEKFIIARHLMYWAVYLHKTVLSAENLLVNILKRAKEIALSPSPSPKGRGELFCTPAFREFLYNKYSKKDFQKDPKLLDTFAELDDHDIMASVKTWMHNRDKVLSRLCSNLINRRLYKVQIQNQPFAVSLVKELKEKAAKKYALSPKEADYFVFSSAVENDIYRPDKVKIRIKTKEGKVADIFEVSDQLSLDVLAKKVKKYFLCIPGDINS